MQKTQNTRQIDKKKTTVAPIFTSPPLVHPIPHKNTLTYVLKILAYLKKKLPLHSDTFQVPFATDENLTLLASSPCLMEVLTCNGAAGKGRKTTGIMGKNVRFKVGTSVVAFFVFCFVSSTNDVAAAEDDDDDDKVRR